MQPKAIGTRLSIMMFLEFFVWGAWYVTTGQYMFKIGLEDSIGWVYTVAPIAAIVSPFFLGMVADRYFSTERVLAVLHVLGGLALFFAPQMAEWSVQLWHTTTAQWVAQGLDPVMQAKEYWIIPAHLPFIGIIFLHMLLYMPTLGLTNSLAFHNITDQEKQFPVIRVFGTIGWIVAGLLVSFALKADESALPLQIAGGGAIALGIYSLFLPHTPPPAKGTKFSAKQALGLDALALMKERSFAVFIVASLLTCIPLAAYYAFAQNFVNHAGFHAPAGVMTIGQMSEIIFMLLMPLFFIRLGVKKMLLMGMLAWVVRYGLFAMGAPDGVTWMLIIGILLHGICYDFFFVTGFIYTDKKCSKEIRGQAQGFLVFVTQGLGLGIGAQVMQRIVTHYKSPEFDTLTTQASALQDQYKELAAQAAKVGGDQAATLMAQANEAWAHASDLLLHSYNWQMIWLIPCIMAAVIMIFFGLFFKNDAPASAPAELDEGDVAEAAAGEGQP